MYMHLIVVYESEQIYSYIYILYTVTYFGITLNGQQNEVVID